uniref:Stabilizer of axonemal microtubules 2 n=1 Tax=Monodon monoceros TaxID=40151 RepID=A0A8C6B180_MONMO
MISYLCLHRRHHCPHGTTRIYENSDLSCPTAEYLENYPVYGSVLPPQSLKPKEEFPAYRCKMEGVTTFKSDSRPYEIVKQPRHAPEEYKPKQGEIDLGTAYKWHLNSCRVQRVAIARPLERQVKKGKLDTVPAYKGNFLHGLGKTFFSVV